MDQLHWVAPVVSDASNWRENDQRSVLIALDNPYELSQEALHSQALVGHDCLSPGSSGRAYRSPQGCKLRECCIARMLILFSPFPAGVVPTWMLRTLHAYLLLRLGCTTLEREGNTHLGTACRSILEERVVLICFMILVDRQKTRCASC